MGLAMCARQRALRRQTAPWGGERRRLDAASRAREKGKGGATRFCSPKLRRVALDLVDDAQPQAARNLNKRTPTRRAQSAHTPRPKLRGPGRGGGWGRFSRQKKKFSRQPRAVGGGHRAQRYARRHMRQIVITDWGQELRDRCCTAREAAMCGRGRGRAKREQKWEAQRENCMRKRRTSALISCQRV